MKRLALLAFAALLSCSDGTGTSCTGLHIVPEFPGPFSLQLNQSFQFSIRRNDAGSGGCVDYNDSAANYTWTSTHPNIASVTAQGVVQAHAVGSTTILANGTAAPYQHSAPAQQTVVVPTPQ